MGIPGPKMRRMWRGNDRGRLRALLRTAGMVLRRNDQYVVRGGKTMLSLADAGNLRVIVANVTTALGQKEQIGS